MVLGVVVLALVGAGSDQVGRSRRQIAFPRVEFAWKFGVVMLMALALTVLPGGGNALDVVLTLLTITFFAAIAFLVYRLYRQYRFDLDALAPNLRLALYGSLALAVLTFTATNRLFDAGGGGRGVVVRTAGTRFVRPVLGLDALPALRLTLTLFARA